MERVHSCPLGFPYTWRGFLALEASFISPSSQVCLNTHSVPHVGPLRTWTPTLDPLWTARWGRQLSKILITLIW